MMSQRRIWTVLIALCFAVSCQSLQEVSRHSQKKSAMISIVEPRCEYQTDPMGLDELSPRLSWKLDSSQRGQKQTAYRVLVASSQENLKKNLGDLWDTGKVDSEQSNQVVYEGKQLTSRMQCFWKVMVWNKEGGASCWSKVAQWSMGLLDQHDWQAKWIGLNEITIDEAVRVPANALARYLKESDWIWFPNGSQKVSVPPGKCYFRCVTQVPSDSPIEKAKIVLSADNRFVLWVNGEKVGSGDNWSQLFSVDISKHLKSGANTIAIEVENVGDTSNPAGLIGSIDIQLANGDNLAVKTDPSWRVSSEEVSGWEKPAFDDSSWAQAKSLGKFGMEPWGEFTTERRRLPALYLRKEFPVSKRIASAKVYISGLGYYQLYLNGRRVGDHELDPILRDYSKQTPYITYEVSDWVQDGNNAIGVMLGCGRFYTPHPSNPIGTRDFGLPRLLYQMEVEYSDGSREVIVSDEDWKITDRGPILNNNDYDGEYYDARREMPGWNRVGFKSSEWKNVDLMSAPAGPMTSAALMQPMRVTGEIKPIRLTEPQPGVWVFDLGQNIVGRSCLRVKGPAGTEVKMHFAENIYPDGMLDFRNLRSAECLDTYILKGDGVETYTPTFTYHGFRYIEVTGFPGKPNLDSLTGMVINTDMPFTGDFECSNPTITQLLKNARWGMRGNYLSIPTDCPQRDERQGWQGDRAGEQLGETYLFDNILLYEKWMGDIRDSQRDDGNLSDVCPNYWSLYSTNVTWPSAFVIIPGNLYRQYGDLRAIERSYPAMKRWMSHLRSFLQDGIIDKDNYGDWCCPPESKELIHSNQPWRKTPKNLLATSYYYNNLMLLADYAELLGKDQEAKQFRAEAGAIYKAFDEKIYDPKAGYYGNGSQTSQILPLRFGLVPEDRQQAIMDYTIEHIRNKTDNHLGTGLIGGQWLMRTLTDRGHGEMAYRLASNRDYPSWGYMIEHDATTIWELWNGNTANPGMNSGNHVMLLGDVIIWMFEDLAGIQADPDNLGFKHIRMEPHLLGDLMYAKADYESIYGKIVSDWKVEGKVFKWDVTVPVNTTATLFIPGKDAANVKESGKPIGKAEGVKVLGVEKDRVLVQVGSGKYRFESTGF